MAEGYLRHFANGKADVYSAGIEAHGVNPMAAMVMKEDGIDISDQTSNKIEDYAHLQFDFVITVCDNAREHCPWFPASVKQLHHNFPDPRQSYRHGRGCKKPIQAGKRQYKKLYEGFCERLSKVVHS
ncbi:MAG: protein-tyrosine-phosphatase [Cyclobacteriaceae bacterium]|nr:MAG: protein-tyrosine-phosphatase [Cyclobacteriaceae bacterium]